MVRAIWNGVVLAEAPSTIRVEGNHYFPPESLHREYFQRSMRKSVCPWKGVASYFNVVAGDHVAKNVAWHYPHPLPPARKIKNYVAFTGAVCIERARSGT